MKITIQCGKGKYNPNYKTAIIWFQKEDRHFFSARNNWMPKHTEIEEILETLIKIEAPDKRKELFDRFSKALDKGMDHEYKWN